MGLKLVWGICRSEMKMGKSLQDHTITLETKNRNQNSNLWNFVKMKHITYKMELRLQRWNLVSVVTWLYSWKMLEMKLRLSKLKDLFVMMYSWCEKVYTVIQSLSNDKMKKRNQTLGQVYENMSMSRLVKKCSIFDHISLTVTSWFDFWNFVEIKLWFWNLCGVFFIVKWKWEKVYKVIRLFWKQKIEIKIQTCAILSKWHISRTKWNKDSNVGMW